MMLGMMLSIIVVLIGILLIALPKKVTYFVLYFLAILLVTYKMIEYTRYGLMLQTHKIPIEFSAISYFVFPIAVIFNIKFLRSIALFMSFLSGIGYLITFPFLYEQFFTHNGYYLTWFAFINHSILFIGSLLLIKIHTFEKKDIKKVLLFTAFYTCYVILMNYLVTFPQAFILIRLILGAEVLSYLYPNSSPTSFDYFVYFAVVILVYQLLLQMFYLLNQAIMKIKKGIAHEHTI